jgi:hypothetical protein
MRLPGAVGAPQAWLHFTRKMAPFKLTAGRHMVVSLDDVSMHGTDTVFKWTLIGTNTGPGGQGKSVFIRGYEEWRFGKTSLIVESKGHFDEADYQRQLIGK